MRNTSRKYSCSYSFVEKIIPAYYLTNKVGIFLKEKENSLKMFSTTNKMGASQIKIGQIYLQKYDERKC